MLYKRLTLLSTAVLVSACKLSLPPFAQSMNLDANAGSETQLTLTAVDLNPQDTLTYAVITPPQHGEVELQAATGEAVYTPAQGYVGADTFTFRANDGVFNSNVATVKLTVRSTDNAAPIAVSMAKSMVGTQPLALTLEGDDENGDSLSYRVITPPRHGHLAGTGQDLTYTPNTGFEGEDVFTFSVSDGRASSEPADVRVNVVGGQCESSQFAGPADHLFLHVPLQMMAADLSELGHNVVAHGQATSRWMSRTDLGQRRIDVQLAASLDLMAAALSFKFQPDVNAAAATLMDADTFDLIYEQGRLSLTLRLSDGSTQRVPLNGTVNTRSCNAITVNFSGTEIETNLNGQLTRQALPVPADALAGALVIGPFTGKAWDVRLYSRTLSASEIAVLGEDCTPGSAAAQRQSGYPNFMCGVYVCEYWPTGITDVTRNNLEYYIHAQDEVYERHILDAGMYPRGKLCDYFPNGSGRTLILNDGIRRTFVAPYSFSNPLTVQNGQFWLHENFHSFQGNLARYNGFGGSKFLLESTASWGADSIFPGVFDSLLGMYTYDPHLPLWTIQDSPVDQLAGHEFKGGHQYGAAVFWSYLTQHVVSKRLIGDIFNDVRASSEPARVAYEWLAKEGIDMKTVFSDYAARVTTWDVPQGDLYRKSELDSLNRMMSDNPNAATFDNKITRTYSHSGTGDLWSVIPNGYTPGGWAFNAYKLSVTRDAEVVAALRIDVTNPAYADFRAKLVVHTPSTGKRVYTDLPINKNRPEASVSVRATAGDEVYLVTSSTPDTFSGWDVYTYQYKLYTK